MIISNVENRTDLAIYFNELGFKKGAEVGVHEGLYSEVLCQNIPYLDLTCVDIWPDENIFQIAKEKLAPFKAKLIRKASLNAVNMISNRSLDFVFIDADHNYESVKDDLENWSKKVKRRGIVAGHDYYVFHNSGNKGVIKAVNEYVALHKLKLYVTKYGPKGLRRDERIPIWYFVNSI